MQKELDIRGITDFEPYSNEIKIKEDKIVLKPINNALYPRIWLGYILAIVIFTYAVYEVIYLPNSTENITPTYLMLSLAGMFYWLFCVRRIHIILEITTSGKYSITPSKAAVFHFFPFYNLYWLFKWPNNLASFLNIQNNSKVQPKGLVGGILLIGFIVWKLIDATIGLIILFLAIGYTIIIMKKVIPIKE